jgi:hypothetical protein
MLNKQNIEETTTQRSGENQLGEAKKCITNEILNLKRDMIILRVDGVERMVHKNKFDKGFNFAIEQVLKIINNEK